MAGDEQQAEMLADKNFESHAAMILLFSAEDDFEVKNDKQPFVKQIQSSAKSLTSNQHLKKSCEMSPFAYLEYLLVLGR